MSKLPTVAIVIPAYNEEETIAKCLDSCLKQSSPPEEIIVVNNNSTDQTAAIVKKYQKNYPNQVIRLLNEPVQGIIAARNHGFNKAKSDILGRIDADSIISEKWVDTVRHTFSKKKVAAATGPVQYHDMPLADLAFHADEKIRNTLHKMAKDHRFLFGSNMAIRRLVWQEIGSLTSLDPDDELHEDIDLALVLFENDLEIAYDPKMIGGMSARRLEDSPRDFYRYVMRFERTFKVHNVRSAAARMPILIYLLIYFPLRTVRKFYDGDTNQFTLQKLRDELSGEK
ncbi:MAG TPA: glycosyltransferase family 2 protein [Candidatus Saccharimonadales bacterium]|nr:glycosyltransferase family 2 protein [Candidatus Saccharimonadales bacterium]